MFGHCNERSKHPAASLLVALLSPVFVWALEGAINSRRTSKRGTQAVLASGTELAVRSAKQYYRVSEWLDKFDPPDVTDVQEKLKGQEERLLRQFEGLAGCLSDTVTGLRAELRQAQTQTTALAKVIKCICTENLQMLLARDSSNNEQRHVADKEERAHE